MSGSRTRASLLALIFVAPLAAQDAEAPQPSAADVAIAPDQATLDAARARFRALDVKKKAGVIRVLERMLSWSDDAAIPRIADLRYEFDSLPEAVGSTPTFGDAATDAGAPYRKAQGPTERQAVEPHSAEYAAVAKRFARPAFLPELRREVEYDWHRGMVVRLAPLGYDELFDNALAGYAPQSDHAVARVLACFDNDADLRKLGAWFSHTYCDLTARAYPGITLYDAWYSGKQVDVPDVDAVPFGWLVLGEKRHVSPLRGKPRDQLYEAIKQAAFRFRVHRTSCEAAAAAFVRAEPDMDPLYALLVPRFHCLFAEHGDDLAKLATLFARGDRDELIHKVDVAVRDKDSPAFARREGRKQELAQMAARVRNAALQALARAGSGP